MRTRIFTAAAMAAALIAVFYYRGVVLLAAAAFLLVVAQIELSRAFGQKDIKVFLAASETGGLCAVAAQFFFGTQAAFAVLMIMAALMIAYIMLIRGGSFENVLYTVFVTGYTAVPIICACAWGYSDQIGDVAWLVLAICSAIGSDTLAFLIGSTLGRHKLCPELSPKKSVEGAAAGVLGGVAFAFAARFVFLKITGVQNQGVLLTLMIGFTGSIAGQTGDLLASLIKRYCGIKDFSSFLPGHGGLLDRIDGITFACAVLYMIFTLIT